LVEDVTGQYHGTLGVSDGSAEVADEKEPPDQKQLNPDRDEESDQATAPQGRVEWWLELEDLADKSQLEADHDGDDGGELSCPVTELVDAFSR
jgi:hypothetical protein